MAKRTGISDWEHPARTDWSRDDPAQSCGNDLARIDKMRLFIPNFLRNVRSYAYNIFLSSLIIPQNKGL